VDLDQAVLNLVPGLVCVSSLLRNLFPDTLGNLHLKPYPNQEVWGSWARRIEAAGAEGKEQGEREGQRHARPTETLESQMK
jgi:hypothetical protein